MVGYKVIIRRENLMVFLIDFSLSTYEPLRYVLDIFILYNVTRWSDFGLLK